MNKYLFNHWISSNYGKIKERLSLQYSFDEDSLHDAYLLCVRTKSEVAYNEFPSLFLKCYHSARKKATAHGFVFIYPDPLFFDFLCDDEEQNEEKPTKAMPSANRIMQYIKAKYKADDILLWNLSMLQGLPNKTIADYTGCSCVALRKKIETMKQDVKQYFNRAI